MYKNIYKTYKNILKVRKPLNMSTIIGDRRKNEKVRCLVRIDDDLIWQSFRDNTRLNEATTHLTLQEVFKEIVTWLSIRKNYNKVFTKKGLFKKR